ncbi:MAG: choice-of-anchor L domain-containing protein [Ignavibacteriae bacterium]|nr:choice-of-anchor L domain-containing protein [Ignavibacteriota bacterium]
MKKLYFLLSVIIISLLFFSGCSEDSSVNNPIEPPVPTGSIGGTIVSAPGEMIVNTNQTVLFRFTVEPGITFIDSIATLTKVDQNNNEISELGTLLDNGNLANGDDIAKDNVYSGLINLNEASPGNIKLRAKGKFSQSEYKYSQVLTINVYAQLTSQNFGILMNTQENAKTQLQTYLGGNPGNIESAVTQLASWLQTQPGVESVESDGTTSLMINYSSGLKGGLVFSVLNSAGEIETRGGFGGDSSARRTAKIPVNKQTTGTNSLNGNFSFHSGDNPPADPNAIGNRNVLIYAPFENAFAPKNERQKIIDRLNQSGCKGFEITSLVNQEATVSTVNTFVNYGYVVLATHGSQGKAFATGEVVDTNAAVYTNTYKALLQAGKLAIWKNMKISTIGAVNVIADIYAVRFPYISSLTGTFPNSVILNNSCESTKNPDLGNAFLGKGAKTYYGYDKVVSSGFCVTIADSVTKRLAVDNMTTSQAFFAASDPGSHHANFQMKVGNNDLKFSNALLNNDFEEGTINAWTKGGDGRVISRLGFVNPAQGNFMGIISTGLGYTTSSGSISQCFAILNNQSTLTLKYNFLSEEFLEYIGSQYQDFFEIKLLLPNGSNVVLYRKTIDQIAAQFGATQQEPGMLVSVSPDIVFDVGGVYMTGWDNLSFDVTAYRGQTVTLVLSAGDVGDSIYDTAILLDVISVQ